MDDKALLLSLGFARPSAREAMESFKEAFPGVSTREGGRVRAFDERTTIGLMLGQALGRNAPCKEAVRRAQLELGMDVSASTAAFCKARGRVLPSRRRTPRRIARSGHTHQGRSLAADSPWWARWWPIPSWARARPSSSRPPGMLTTSGCMSKHPAGSRRANCTSETGLSARSPPSRSFRRWARTG